MTGQEVFQLVLQQIEGPYKWYVLGGLVIAITAFVTHFVFKTLKWVLLIGALAFILFYLWSQLFGRLDQFWPTDNNSSVHENKFDVLHFLGNKTDNQ